MIYYLHELSDLVGFFNIFRYVTLRAAMGAITAFIFSVIVGKRIILFLKSRDIKENAHKTDSELLAKMHSGKTSTPTMGGLIILTAFSFSTLLWCNLDQAVVWIILLSTLAMGAVGAYDDWMKLTIEKSKGMSSRMKMFLLLIIGSFSCMFLLISLNPGFLGDVSIYKMPLDFLYYGLDDGQITTLQLPFKKEWLINLGWFYVPVFVFILVGTTNAVNLTDGLDGLAVGCMLFVTMTYLIISYVVGHMYFSEYLNILHVPEASEVSVLCAIVIGACLGFYWFNSHPAEVFMGDTGSLALGGFIGSVALVTKHEIILVLAGGVFVLEALSVILQVGYYKRTKKRIFKCAPLHHHFQFKGMPETKIVARFWVLGIVFSLLALASLKIR